MISRLILLMYQFAMYVGHIAAAPSDVEWARGHPMYFCNWLPSELLARVREARAARLRGENVILQAYVKSKAARESARRA